MKNILVKAIVDFIITIASMLMLIILTILGILVYQEITHGNGVEKVENLVSTYQTLFSDVEDTSKKTTPDIIESNTTTAESGNMFSQMPSTPATMQQSSITTENLLDKYFYGQLDNYSKVIYQALYENKEQMKTGTKQINLGTTFSELLSAEDGEKKLGEYYQSAVETYLYDNPDVFYIAANKLYLNIETTTRLGQKSYRVFINSGKSPNYFTDEYSSEQDVEQAIQEVEAVKNQILLNKTGNKYSDIKMIHDYLINNLEYDTTISKPNIYNIYGALVNKQCVCEGYAEAFKYLLDQIGIQNVLIMGQGTNSKGNIESHAWNYVQIDSKWYAVDVTWDDPVVVGNGYVSNSMKYQYFLKGEFDISKDHTPSTRFTENGREYTYPILSANNYE